MLKILHLYMCMFILPKVATASKCKELCCKHVQKHEQNPMKNPCKSMRKTCTKVCAKNAEENNYIENLLVYVNDYHCSQAST